MRQVPGSIPGFSKLQFIQNYLLYFEQVQETVLYSYYFEEILFTECALLAQGGGGGNLGVIY